MSKNFLEGWHRIFSAGVSGLVKKPSTVLLYRSIVLQHMHKPTLGYTGYTKVKCIFQLHVLHFFGDNVHCCFHVSNSVNNGNRKKKCNSLLKLSRAECLTLMACKIGFFKR